MRTDTPVGSWWRSCAIAGSSRCSSAATRASCTRWRTHPDSIPGGVGRRSGLARPGIGRRGRGHQLRRPVRLDRRPGDRGRAARRDPVRGRGGRDRGQRRHVHALHRPRPGGRRRGGPGDGLLRRARRPAGHDGDGRLDGGRRGARRVRAEQLAPHGRDASPRARSPASGALAGGSATPAAGWSTTPASGTCRPSEWDFPAPLGRRSVLGEFTMADVVTIPSHLAIPEVRTYMTIDAATDLVARTPAPVAVDERGRSAQTFTVDVIVRRGDTQRRVVAAARTSTPSAHRWPWRRSSASSMVRRGRAASPPPARSSTRPTSCGRCRRSSPSNRSGTEAENSATIRYSNFVIIGPEAGDQDLKQT